MSSVDLTIALLQITVLLAVCRVVGSRRARASTRAVILGAGLALSLAGDVLFFRAGAGTWEAMILVGAAMSGALMNARGVIELVRLNIGLERRIITPTLFTVMVVMAIGTTLMASPLFRWTQARAHAPAPRPHPARRAGAHAATS